MLNEFSAPATERRASERFDVEMPSVIASAGAEPVSCTVLDLSTTGFRAELAGELKISGKIWIRLPGQLATEATVRWHKNGQIGALFDVPFHPSLVRRWVEAHPRTSGFVESSSRASSVIQLLGRLRRKP